MKSCCRNKYVIVLLLAWFSISVFVAAEEGNSLLNSGEKEFKVTVVPVIYYKPETQLAFGFGGLFSFKPFLDMDRLRFSSIESFFTYTQKNQIRFSVLSHLYFGQGDFRLSFYLEASRFADKYFGIGPQSAAAAEELYSLNSLWFKAGLLKTVSHGFSIGLRWEFFAHKLTDVQEGGLLADPDTPGMMPSRVSGCGFKANWDTRDRLYSASKGSVHRLDITFFRKFMGSDFSFSKAVLESCQYFSLASGHVLALQSYISLIGGEAPFFMMSQMGGDSLMRGYWQGRYRDKNMLVMQMEYRLPLWKKFGAAAFLGFGGVAPRINDFDFRDLRHSLGLGIRYALNMGMNIRMDLGFGSNSSGIYFTVNDAF